MTELDFWAALVADYNHTASRLPTLTSNKIRAGVPPPLRGVVWPSLAGARDSDLLDEFARLTGVTSPYEGLIGKDIGRSFPSVEMFRDPNGEGQQMLGRVLRSFSLYDEKIGYCQGLGFVVGPLLMHMSDAEAFCVLVRYVYYNCFCPAILSPTNAIAFPQSHGSLQSPVLLLANTLWLAFTDISVPGTPFKTSTRAPFSFGIPEN